MRSVRCILSLCALSYSVAAAQLTGAFYEDTFWPTWGGDLHKSHFQPNVAGPDTPSVKWVRNYNAVDEPLVFGDLWFPQSRYYRALEVERGRVVNPGAPFYSTGSDIYYNVFGNPVTPIFLRAPILVQDQDGLLRPDIMLLISIASGFNIENWPVYFMSGGQYDSVVVNIDPFTGESIVTRLPGRPAYRGSFGARVVNVPVPEDSDMPTPWPIPAVAFMDTFGNVYMQGYYWMIEVEVDDDTGEVTIEDYAFVPFPADQNGIVWIFPPFIPYTLPGGKNMFTTDNTGNLYTGSHFGTLSSTVTDYAGDFLGGDNWFTDIATLTEGDITSDTFDLPVVMTSDESTLIAVTTNSGEILGVNPADGTALWRTNLGVPFSAGPSIGIGAGGGKALGGGEETVYVVGRSSNNVNRFSVYALTTNGDLKWEFGLLATSRCTPLIDANGVIYVGDERGILYAINPDGSSKWQMNLRYPIRVTPMLDENGDLYVGSGGRTYGITQLDPPEDVGNPGGINPSAGEAGGNIRR